MRKEMKFLALLIVFIFSFVFVFAANETTTIPTTQTIPATQIPITQASYSSSFNLNTSKLDLAESCINKKAGNCASLSIPELAFTILSQSANNVSEACTKVLKSKQINGECFGTQGCSVKDTGLAILALDSLGEDTSKAENWLINKSKTSKELTWILELDTDIGLEMNCKIAYRGNEYSLKMKADKSFDADAGNCLSRDNNGLWLKVSDSCYDTDFAITCDQNFKSVILAYDSTQNKFLVPLTKEASAFGTLTQKVSSKCISTTSTCSYEDNLWATLALYKKGKDIVDYLPYLKFLEDKNKRFTPDSFIYMETGDESYGNSLVKDEKLGNYWESDGTPYNRFYDTALALFALTGTSEDVVSSVQGRMIFSQDGKTGCWNNALRETAILLWALKGWSSGAGGGGGGGGATIEDCIYSGFYCMKNADCAQNDILDNYQCIGLNVCCRNQILRTCTEEQGKKCNVDESCTGGIEKDTLDGKCCLGTCEKIIAVSECEQAGNSCGDSCLKTENKVDMQCDENKVCCELKPLTPVSSGGSLLWLWILLIVLILLLILAIIYKDKLKLWLFKIKSKFKKEKRPLTPIPSMPMVRPGFPPIRRPLPVMPQRRPFPQAPIKTYTSTKIETKTTKPSQTKEKMDDVFKKLRDMSK
jgi:hypothetical protein